MEKEKLFYSEDDFAEDNEDENRNDELTQLISSDNARTQYSLYVKEIRKASSLSGFYAFGSILLMVLFFWLAFAIFPQHRFAFNFGDGTYSSVLIPSILAVVMSFLVLSLNIIIQIFGFIWNNGNKTRIEKLIRISKRLELRDLTLDSNIYSASPILKGVSLFHGLLILAGVVALVGYLVVYFI